MKKLLAFLGAIAFMGIGVVALAAPAAGADPGEDPHKVPHVTVDQARSAVARITPAYASQLAYRGTKDRPGIRAFSFASRDVEALVDVSDGHVSLVQLPVPTPHGDAKLSADEAQRTAVSYLASVGSPANGLSVAVKLIASAGIPTYVVEFSRTADGVTLPDARMVQLDAVDGHVLAFADVRRPYSNPGTPRLRKSDAQTAAVKFAGGGAATRADLGLTWDKAGVQSLVWTVEVHIKRGESGRVIEVDAQTGAARDQVNQ